MSDMDFYIEENRKTTTDLISSEPTSVTLLRRPALVRTAAGGVRRDAPVTPQEARNRFFGGVTADVRRIVRETGQEVVTSHVLIGEHDDDIQEDDRFTIWNRNFRVVFVYPDRRWQTKAWVTSDGS